MRKAPPLPFLLAEWHGREVLVFAVVHAGSVDEGRKAAEPLRRLGEPIVDAVGPQPFVGWQSAFDPLLTPGASNYLTSPHFTKPPDGAIHPTVEAAKTGT